MEAGLLNLMELPRSLLFVCCFLVCLFIYLFIYLFVCFVLFFVCFCFFFFYILFSFDHCIGCPSLQCGFRKLFQYFQTFLMFTSVHLVTSFNSQKMY